MNQLTQHNDDPDADELDTRGGALAAGHDKPAPTRKWVVIGCACVLVLGGLGLIYIGTNTAPVDAAALRGAGVAQASATGVESGPPHPGAAQPAQPGKQQPATEAAAAVHPGNNQAAATTYQGAPPPPKKPRVYASSIRAPQESANEQKHLPTGTSGAAAVAEPAKMVAAWANKNPLTSTAPTLVPCVMLGATDSSASTAVDNFKQCQTTAPIRNAANTAPLLDAGLTVTLRVLPVRPGQRIANALATEIRNGGLYGWKLPDAPMLDAHARTGVQARVDSHTAERVGLAILQVLAGTNVTGVLGTSGGAAVVTPAVRTGATTAVATLPEQFNTAPAAHLEPNRVVLVALPTLDASAIFNVEATR